MASNTTRCARCSHEATAIIAKRDADARLVSATRSCADCANRIIEHIEGQGFTATVALLHGVYEGLTLQPVPVLTGTGEGR